MIMIRKLLLYLLLATSVAGSTYYSDTDVSVGTHVGTQSNPWQAINWTTINSDLASQDVTIYFSSREASSDVDETYDTAAGTTQSTIDISQRTDGSDHILTFDGGSFYNTSDSSPSWLAYSGTSRCIVNSMSGQDCSHAKHSNITIQKLHIKNRDDSKAVAVAGDNWIVQDCEAQHTAGAGGSGPCIMLTPTADAGHEGSSCYSAACSNLVFRRLYVHDTQGEGFYIGGGGTPPISGASGYPSHFGILIESCIISNCGIFGGQGDGIDVKGGIRALTIRSNVISWLRDPNSSGIRGIVVQGQSNNLNGVVLIEGNSISNCIVDDAAIAIVNSWGTPMGVTNRNNLVVNNTSGNAFTLYDSQDTTLFENNTMYGNTGIAIDFQAGSAAFVNNLALANNGSGSQVSFSGTVSSSDYNAFESGKWGYGSEGAHSVTCTTSVFNNLSAGNFDMAPGSSIKNSGLTLASFSYDIYGRPRPVGSGWAIGSFEELANFLYYDPDYTGGSNDGSSAHPWTSMTSTEWKLVDSALITGPVTLFFSALKANGSTQQSQATFMHPARHYPSGNKLKLDGYSYYNSSVGSPVWTVNPNPDIQTAKLAHQVAAFTGSGGQAFGWQRVDTSAEVTFGGTNFVCTRSHISAAGSNKPMVDSAWTNFWYPHGVSGNAWVASSNYWCGPRQDDMEISGFEFTGANAVCGGLGDNLVWDNIWSHDTLGNGAALSILYTSYPDDSTASIIARPTTNVTIRNCVITNTYGEGIYVGSANPDAPESLQATNGNQMYYLTVSNCIVRGCGRGSGQGDGLDCKNGIIHGKVIRCEFGNLTNTQGGVIVPQALAGMSQDWIIDSCYIHDVSGGLSDEGKAIYMISSVYPGDPSILKGYDGVTIRNTKIARTKKGMVIQSAAIVKNITNQNNLVTGVTADVGIDFDGTDGGCELMNTIVYGNNSGGAQVGLTSVTVSNNFFSDTFGATCASCVGGVSASDFVNASIDNFTLIQGKPEVNAAITIGSFNYDRLGVTRPQGSAWDGGPDELPPGPLPDPDVLQVFGSMRAGGINLKLTK